MPLENHQLGHYRLLHLIGSGGMGEIYLADDMHMPRKVAIKVIRSEDDPYRNDSNAKEMERLFEREMTAIASLDHPHILPVFDYGRDNIGDYALTYLVMPYQAEGSLLNWVRKREQGAQLTPREAIHILLQAADALQHAHEHSIIHQDIKPPNFLIRRRNNATDLPDVLLTDFGIARFISLTSTSSQSVRGTPTYMPPEQWEGQPVPASDQYSLAIMAFQFLTGSTPFHGSAGQVMHQHFTAPPPLPGRLNPHLPSAVDAVLLRALAKRPAERFPSVLQFAQVLLQALEQDQVQLPVRAGRNQAGASIVDGAQAEATLIRHLPPEMLRADPRPGAALPAITPAPQMPIRQEQQVVATPTPPPAVMPPFSLPVATGSPTKPPAFQRRGRLATWQKALALGLIALVFLGSGGLLLAHFAGAPASGNQAIPTLAPGALTATQASSLAHGTATAVQGTATTIQATATAVALDPYLSGKGKLLLSDPLNVARHWQASSSGSWGGLCTFTRNAYHIAQYIGPNRDTHCYADRGTLKGKNFIFAVQISLVSGDCGGLAFHQDPALHRGYDYRLCSDGTAELRANFGRSYTALFKASPAAFSNGYNHSTTLAVVSQGQRISLYVNKQKIAEINDTNFASGAFGFYVSDLTKSTEAAFSNAKIWQL